MNLETAVKNLTAHGFSVRVFRTAQDAANAISQELSDKTVGFGGSVTLEQMQLFETLQKNNTVYWHWKQTPAQALENARSAQVYLTSANAISETGEIVNIDGTGNRVASMLCGHGGALHRRRRQQARARPCLRHGPREKHCRALKCPPAAVQNALRAGRAHALS